MNNPRHTLIIVAIIASAITAVAMHNKKIEPIIIPQTITPVEHNAHTHQYIHTHRYNKDMLYTNIVTEYAPALELLHGYDDSSRSKKMLKDHVMLHNESYNKVRSFSLFSGRYKNRPYIQYKNLLDQRIQSLNNLMKKLNKKNNTDTSDMKAEITMLINNLAQINALVIITNEYHQEQISLESDNLSIPVKAFKFGVSAAAGKLFL